MEKRSDPQYSINKVVTSVPLLLILVAITGDEHAAELSIGEEQPITSKGESANAVLAWISRSNSVHNLLNLR